MTNGWCGQHERRRKRSQRWVDPIGWRTTQAFCAGAFEFERPQFEQRVLRRKNPILGAAFDLRAGAGQQTCLHSRCRESCSCRGASLSFYTYRQTDMDRTMAYGCRMAGIRFSAVVCYGNRQGICIPNNTERFIIICHPWVTGQQRQGHTLSFCSLPCSGTVHTQRIMLSC